MRPYLLLAALCLALFLPGLTGLPPIDRDESRFAQASKQMIESGDYIRIKFQDESRAKKPAGIYWLQVASVKLTGADLDAIWAYRLPSLLGALAAVLLCFAFGRRLIGDNPALIGSALLAASFLLVSEAHQAKTDAMQLACVVAAQGILARLFVERKLGWGLALAFWAAIGCGILIKGPVVPMISLLTVLVLVVADREWRWLADLRVWAGIPLAAAIVGPWAWAISQATQGQFIGTAVKTDLLPKLLGAQESHGGAPGTYLLLLLATLWPASLFAIPALPAAWARRKEPVQRFLLAWIIPNWLMFEAIPTKLPHYILPVYPALALLAGMGSASPLWFGLIWGLVGTALAAVPMAAPVALKLPVDWTLLPLSLIILAVSWMPVLMLRRGRRQDAVKLALLAALIAYGGVFALAAPRLEPLWISSRIAALVPAGAPLTASGFHEPSLVFLHGTETALRDGGGAADFLADHPEGWAAIENEATPDFLAELQKRGISVHSEANIDGFNYSRGRPAHVTLWRVQG